MKYKPAVTFALNENIITLNGIEQAKYGTFPTKELAQKKCNELNFKTIILSKQALDKKVVK